MTRPPTPKIPTQGDERTLLVAFLDYYRAALVDRAYGLTDEQLQIAHPPTTLTLSRLIGHMTFVESYWFKERFDGEEAAEPWISLDWEADQDAEMTLAQSLTRAELLARFNAAVADAQARTGAAQSLDQLSVGTDRDGEHSNLRWILIHMIEEYARHCGHADLIREAIDGDVDS